MKDLLLCLSCHKSENGTLKLMPCLHLYCFECLEKLVDTNCITMPKRDDDIKCSIFPCSVCGYVVRVINKDTNFLKNVQLREVCDLNDEVASDKIPTQCDESKEFLKSNCCEDSILDDLQQFCDTCKIFVCAKCLIQSKHDNHDFCSDDALVENKRLKLHKMCSEMKQHREMLLERFQMNNDICESLKSNKDEVKTVILARYQEIINKIDFHKMNLLSQLESTHSLHNDIRTDFKNIVLKDINSIDECLKFCFRMLRIQEKPNLVNIIDELSTHVSRILVSKTVASGVIHHMMLEETDTSKEELLIEKLFGSLVLGSIMQCSPHLSNVYHTNVSWPCCLATNTKDFLLAGKLETFGGNGKLLFSDKDMKSVKYTDLPENCLPLDLLHLPDDNLLLSMNNGSITKYSFQGTVLDKWVKCFEGTAGRLAQCGRERFFVTSANNLLLVRSNIDGKIFDQIILQIESPVRCITSGSKFLYCILEDNSMKIFDLLGRSIESGFNYESYNSKVKCPSSLICDPFGNILVSDFMSDCVYFFDRKGKCLGPILSQHTDSITCPNKIILDSCGNLYVAQYGGDVHVFDYLSCAKKV